MVFAFITLALAPVSRKRGTKIRTRVTGRMGYSDFGEHYNGEHEFGMLIFLLNLTVKEC